MRSEHYEWHDAETFVGPVPPTDNERAEAGVWIRLSEGLPEVGRVVWVSVATVQGNLVEQSALYLDGQWYAPGGGRRMLQVTHWRPIVIPAPPLKAQ